MYDGGVLTIGYIGNGKSANRYHLPFSTLLTDKIRVKTVYARSLDKQEWPRLGIIKYTDNLEELLSDGEIELVVITTPVAGHYELAKEVLESGKHCVVEKPFTLHRFEAEELFALAEEKGLMLQAYQNRRFDSDFLTAKKVLEQGKLGEPLEMELHFDYYRPQVPWSRSGYSAETSFVYEHASHSVDQVISLFGNPTGLHTEARQLLGRHRMCDYFDIDIFYGTLKVSVKSSYFRLVGRPSIVIYGDKGVFVKKTCDRQEEHLKVFYMPDKPDFGADRPEDYGVITYEDTDGIFHEEKVITEPGGYWKYYSALYETLKYGKTPLVSKEDTLTLVGILEEAVRELD